MTTTEIIKGDYLKHTRKVLYDYPDALRTFEDLWQAGKIREAYLSVDEFVRKQGIMLTPEQRKADQDFYWDVIN